MAQDREKLVNINGLSADTGLPVRSIRTAMQARKIPYLKLGHRTILFSPAKVREALDRFEIRSVTSK